MSNLMQLSVLEQAKLVKNREVSPIELVEDSILQIETINPKINAVVTPMFDFAREQAKKISKNESKISKEGKFSWVEVECLGACVNAPMIQINDDYFEDLDPQKLEKIIDQINDNKQPIPGSYRGRLSSEPENNRKTLLNIKNA